jgi:hypothetical protein
MKAVVTAALTTIAVVATAPMANASPYLDRHRLWAVWQ